MIPGTADVPRDQGPRTMLFLNPPDHTRLRSLVSRAFTPRRIEGMRGAITQLAVFIVAHSP